MEPIIAPSPVVEPDFRAVFETTPSPYLVLAPDFTIVAVNEAYLHATQTSRSQILGRDLFEVFPDTPLDPASNGVADLRNSLLWVLWNKRPHTMAVQKYDIPIPGPNGIVLEERYCSPINTPILNANGEVTHIIHRMENVTEFAKTQVHASLMASEISHQAMEIQDANKQLRESNEKLDRRVAVRTEELRREREYLRSLLMAVPVPVSVMMGPEHVYQLENHAHRELTRHRNILNKPFRKAFPEMADWMQPILDQVYQTGKPYHMARQKIAYARKQNGSLEDAYFALSWHPLFGGDGKVEGVITATIDITGQVHTEERLQKSEARYRSLFDSIDEGFCIIEMLFDQSGHPVDYLFCETNPVFEMQTGLHGAVGRTVLELVPQHDAHWFDTYGKVAKTGIPIRFENEAKALKRWFDVYAFRIDDPNEQKVAVLFKDITDQNRAEEELRRSERHALEAARQAKAERRRLNAVLDAAPVGIVMANANGTILQANRENKRLWGQNQPRSKSVPQFREWKGWWADGSERQGQRIESHEWPLARALRGENAPHCIIEIEPFDAPFAHRTVLASGAPIRDGEGKVAGAVVALMDITDRVRTEASLRETAARLQFILQSAQLGAWEFDLVTGKNVRSLRHDQCFGYAEPIPDWGFDKFIEHVHPEDRAWIKREFEEVIARVQGIKDWHFECRVIWPDGSLHWIEVHGSVYAVHDKPVRLAGIIADITDRKQTEEKAHHASLHDPLTGLPNRTMLFEYASHLLPHNRRTKQFAAVLFLDLDRFKPINDTHGHEVGDAVLKEVGHRLAGSLRADDIVIRLGGDEFVILLQGIKHSSYAAEVARHVVNIINEPYHIGELVLSLSTSIGISIFHHDGEDIDTLISHADMAMYQAKQAGRNNFQFYSPEFSARTKLQLSIEQQLKTALSTEAFHLFYQPVIDVNTGEIVSVEALLRWQNPDIGPDRFVPVAEATGIINPIGRWLMKEASRQYKAWADHGLPPIPIAVNVSVVEFRDRNFANRFERTIRKQGIDTKALQLELTETAVMDDIEHAVAMLSQLKALGVTILLDDFGTGHSSLAYLARLPLNKVKIDKSFISRLENDVASRAVTDAMIALGRTLNLEIVAEGIESANVLDYISSHGCNQGQGFYLGRPMSGDSFEEWYWEHGQELKNTGWEISQRH